MHINRMKHRSSHWCTRYRSKLKNMNYKQRSRCKADSYRSEGNRPTHTCYRQYHSSIPSSEKSKSSLSKSQNWGKSRCCRRDSWMLLSRDYSWILQSKENINCRWGSFRLRTSCTLNYCCIQYSLPWGPNNSHKSPETEPTYYSNTKRKQKRLNKQCTRQLLMHRKDSFLPVNRSHWYNFGRLSLSCRQSNHSKQSNKKNMLRFLGNVNCWYRKCRLFHLSNYCIHS